MAMPKRTWWMKRHDTVNFVGSDPAVGVMGCRERPFEYGGASLPLEGGRGRLLGQPRGDLPTSRRSRSKALVRELGGTLGGFAAGVLAAGPISMWLGTEASVISVCIGLTLSWGSHGDCATDAA